MSDFLKHLRQLIPELHFDLISRILAGLVFLLVLSKWCVIFVKMDSFDPGPLMNLPEVSFSEGLFIVMISYVIGLFLCSILAFTFSFYARYMACSR